MKISKLNVLRNYLGSPLVPIAPSRVVIAGVPRSGKSTLASKYSGDVLHTDDLIGADWSEASRKVSEDWFNRPGPWVVEGMTAVRALRKWLESHKEGKPCDVVYWGHAPKVPTSGAQNAMGLGHSRIWEQVMPELQRRGCEISTF